MLRGAQFRLAKALRIDQSNIRRWMSGGYLPKETLRPKLAKTLKVSEAELMASLAQPTDPGGLSKILPPEEMAALKKVAEKDTRSPVDELRWLVKAYAAGRLVEAPGYTLK